MPYPARLTLQLPDDAILSITAKIGGPLEIERESAVLQALSELGLPVPRVTADPIPMPDEDSRSELLLMSELPGKPLPWLGTISLEQAQLSCRLLIEGSRRLHELTPALLNHGARSLLSAVTLEAELEQVRPGSGPWLRFNPIARALDLLPGALKRVETPLVFSNGDYNPLNFLHNGEELTGWVDFAGACFEDPHIGMVKFLLWSQDEYGWGNGVKAGLVERYLYAQGLSPREFAPRLALRCLRHLQREVSGPDNRSDIFREHLLACLTDALRDLR